MLKTAKAASRQLLEILLAMTPWVLAMYTFYWLESSGTWTSDTAHRGKISVILLGSGMVASFLLATYFIKRR